ncbi:MAG: hypothetical protein LBK95_11610 [Bifidobacteriaceae bacterium]|nr:hypothetical protein [Bifidobacteriaceae bacterium]
MEEHQLVASLGDDPGPIVYHYTTLANMWSMLASDQFWASDARFSNDASEVESGKGLLERHFSDLETEADAADRNTDRNAELKRFGALWRHYIVCFCDDPDLLGQWREYAVDGVAIEFDFSGRRQFQVHSPGCKCSELEDPKATPTTATPAGPLATATPAAAGGCRFLHYAYPMAVHYFQAEPANGNGPKAAVDRAKQLAAGGVTPDPVPWLCFRVVPYVKHGSFSQESEARLVISLSTNDPRHEDSVFYRDDHDLGVKRPSLHLTYGDQTQWRDACAWIRGDQRIAEAWARKHGGGDFEDHVRQKLSLPDDFPVVFDLKPLEHDHDHAPVYLGPGTDARSLFGKIRDDVLSELEWSDFEKDADCDWPVGDTAQDPLSKPLGRFVRVWCDGHLPIRGVTVGPHPRLKEIKEAIEHFFSTHWWLRDATVKPSKIPYRRPRSTR